MNETVLQFGAGNFLRGFVDTFLHEMNVAGQEAGKVVVVQSTGKERAAALNAQQGRFHLLVRGEHEGRPSEKVLPIESLSRALTTAEEWEAVLEVARSPHLRAITSNTTEAGLCLEKADAFPPDKETAPASFPAKLLAVLRERFLAGQPGVSILPCELVNDNGQVVRRLVGEQAALWGWDTDPAFRDYLDNRCYWVSSVVDRIVTGMPDTHPLRDEDNLLTVTEFYASWIIEDRPGTEWLDHPAIQRSGDVRPFALRKIRILNGAHTALVAHLKQEGRSDIRFVREAMNDPGLRAWLEGLIFEEIVPTIEDRAPEAARYARQTLDRFANPLLDHRLSDIALHHETKMQVRLVPTYQEYVNRLGVIPPRLGAVLGIGE